MSDITWTNGTRKLSDLVPWEHNPKRMGKKAGEGLHISLEKFGYALPMLVSPNSDLYDGHQRLPLLKRMIKEYGPDATVDVRVSSRLLTDDERRELIIRLKQNQAGWDFDMLPNLYEREELLEWGFELEELGMFDDVGESADAEPQIDRAAELNEKWQVKPGDMFSIASHRLICGDCTDSAVVQMVMGGEKAAAVVTDPPYGIGADKKAAHSSIRDNPAWANVDWDKKPSGDHIRMIANFADRVAVWGGNFFADVLPVSSGWLAWVKPQYGTGFSLSDMELCWTNQSIGARCKEFGRRDGHEHPTQKPVDLIAWTIEKIDDKGTALVVDFYLGSGTTMIACENLGRRCRGIEISPNYCAVALQRMEDAFPGILIERVDG